MENSLAGQRVSRVSFDFAVSLLTDEGTELRLEAPFTLSTAEGAWNADPEALSPGAGKALLGLLRRVVVAARCDESGRLDLDVEGGARLVIDPVPGYEAWTLTGTGGLLMVCLPGGGLATWPPEGAADV